MQHCVNWNLILMELSTSPSCCKTLIFMVRNVMYHTHTHTHTQTHTDTHTYTLTYTLTHRHTHRHTHTQTHTDTRTHARTHAHKCTVWAEGRFFGMLKLVVHIVTSGLWRCHSVQLLFTTHINNVSLNKQIAKETSRQAAKEHCFCS